MKFLINNLLEEGLGFPDKVLLFRVLVNQYILISMPYTIYREGFADGIDKMITGKASDYN